MFERALLNDRLSHGYAFVGPAHIGKTTFAIDLAAALGAHPVMDVILFDSEEGLNVQEARTLQSRLNLTPAGQRKIAIIAGAETMNDAVSNSLLKIMEEPPPRSIIILVTNNFYALLPTVASRVQRINFTPASEDEITEAAGRINLPEPEKAEIISWAAGRIGLLKRLAQDQEIRDFFKKATNYWTLAITGNLRSRLCAAQELAGFSEVQIRQFLEMGMRQCLVQNQSGSQMRKLLAAWENLRDNLNKKLLLDNLFI